MQQGQIDVLKGRFRSGTLLSGTTSGCNGCVCVCACLCGVEGEKLEVNVVSFNTFPNVRILTGKSLCVPHVTCGQVHFAADPRLTVRELKCEVSMIRDEETEY